MVEPGAISCPRCGSTMSGGSKFCPSCGAPVEPPAPAPPATRYCPNCGNQNPATSGFCPRCGTNLQAPWTPPYQPVPQGMTGTYAPPPQGTGSSKGLIAGIVTFVIVLVLIFAVLAVSGVFDPIDDGGSGSNNTGTTIGAGDYSWTYKGTTYRMDINISTAVVEQYRNNPMQRYATSIDEAVSMCDAYVTSTDGVVQDVADRLSNFSASFSDAATANFVLSFVQYIEYVEDGTSVSEDEYWRFPVETLYDKMGDCEDKAFLYASIMEAMGFDAVILLFDGHAATGISVNGEDGTFYNFEGSKYYYCETTATGWQVGEIPDEYGSAYISQVD